MVLPDKSAIITVIWSKRSFQIYEEVERGVLQRASQSTHVSLWTIQKAAFISVSGVCGLTEDSYLLLVFSLGTGSRLKGH
jgi:hypothetical protein